MNPTGLDRRLLVPRPGRLAARMSLGVAIPLVVVVVAAQRSGQPAIALFGALFMVAQIAAAVTTAHKEIIAASPSYFQPGLRRGLLSAQLTWAAALAVGAAVLFGLLVPGFTALRVATTLGASLGVYALLALATLHIPWAFQIPVWMFYLWFLVPSLVRLSREGRLDAALDAPLPWLAVAVLLLALLTRSLLTPRLYRKLHGAYVLGSEDLLRPGRIVAYKQQRGRHGRPGPGPAWRRRLIDHLLQRAAGAGLRGRTVAARVWQLLALDVALSVGVCRRTLTILVLGTLVLMLFFGYYDGLQSGGTMDKWFAGLTYQWAVWPLFSLSAVLLSAPMAAVSRRTGFRAERTVIARMTAVALGGAILTAALFAALAALLPPVPWAGRDVSFAAPPLHCVWLMPMLAPFAWLAAALRPAAQHAAGLHSGADVHPRPCLDEQNALQRVRAHLRRGVADRPGRRVCPEAPLVAVRRSRLTTAAGFPQGRRPEDCPPPSFVRRRRCYQSFRGTGVRYCQYAITSVPESSCMCRLQAAASPSGSGKPTG